MIKEGEPEMFGMQTPEQATGELARIMTDALERLTRLGRENGWIGGGDAYDPTDLAVFMWRQVAGSTAGPWGGIGGQTLTGYWVHVFVLDIHSTAAVYMSGRFVRTLLHPNHEFFQRIVNMDLPVPQPSNVWRSLEERHDAIP